MLCRAAAGNGFFINTALLMYSMLVNAWLCLLLVLLSGVTSTGTVLDDSLAVVGGLQVLQLGSLSVLVYVATVWLEDGFFTTIKNVLKQFVAGAGRTSYSRPFGVVHSVWGTQTTPGAHTGAHHTLQATVCSTLLCAAHTSLCIAHAVCTLCTAHALNIHQK